MEKTNSLIGAHVSIAGSIELSVERAETIGANCMQIFVKNNRQWSPPKITFSEAEKFRHALKKSQIKSVVAHATYLINLCSQNPEVREKSAAGLKAELGACDSLEIKQIVLHPGSNPNPNKPDSILLIANTINELYAKNNFQVTIALETMAGQGGSIGSKFEEIAEIISRISNKEKIGVCLDTCHIFAAGYDIRTTEAYEKALKEFDCTIGLKYLKVIHMNDSKKELSSHVDRHEHIGDGKIGLSGFEFIMNDLRLTKIPKIIETPKEESQDDSDKKNIKILKSLIKQ